MGKFSVKIEADKAGLAEYLGSLYVGALAAGKAAKAPNEAARQNGIAEGLARAMTVITEQWVDTSRPPAASGNGDSAVGHSPVPGTGFRPQPAAAD